MTVDTLVVLARIGASVMWEVFELGAWIVRYTAEESR